MTDLIELLKKPKQWVNECQQHLTELGYTRDELTKKINELKPDYPTCKSCKRLYEKNKVTGWYCSYLGSINDPDNFGCIHHSSLGE